MSRAKTLAGAAACAGLTAWMPLALGITRDTLPIPQIENAMPGGVIDTGTQPLRNLAQGKMRAGENGSIESIRETERESEASEITVRLQDESSRAMIDANPGAFQPDQRVKIIDELAGPGA